MLNNATLTATDLSKEAKEDMLKEICRLIRAHYLCNILADGFR